MNGNGPQRPQSSILKQSQTRCLHGTAGCSQSGPKIKRYQTHTIHHNPISKLGTSSCIVIVWQIASKPDACCHSCALLHALSTAFSEIESLVAQLTSQEEKRQSKMLTFFRRGCLQSLLVRNRCGFKLHSLEFSEHDQRIPPSPSKTTISKPLTSTNDDVVAEHIRFERCASSTFLVGAQQ